MLRLFEFSESTFSSLSSQQQHKKCAEVLKAIVSAQKPDSLFALYNTLCSWISCAPLENSHFETIERRFHEHIRLSGRGISEHDFLFSITTKDKKEASDWLCIETFLDGVRSAHNAGSIIRTIEAFRLGPLHFSKEMFSPKHPQVQKRSMNAWKEVSIYQAEDMTHLPRPWIALETATEAPSWNEWIYPKKATLILGNEERGIQKSVLQMCDVLIRIPLCGRKNSLNVANAFAIVAAEISSQQRD